MSSVITLHGIHRICKRYGPGRLPGADRRHLGAGYAAASAALALALAFAAGVVLLDWLGSPFGVGHVFWAASAVVAIPIVVPTAFAVSTLIWSAFPVDGTAMGALAGGVTVAATYLGSLAVVFAIVTVGLVSGSDGSSIVAAVVDAGRFTAAIGLFAVILSGWLAVPVGCLGGAVYERVRAGAKSPAETTS
ncbi:hypothetical protein [Halopiger goleimassiliensis]|uniref:hypothetical protein n=1 Tax=Halopiger goleimassiliensis TaxID=1293048 RepID=UPI0006782147|nr:hypothetical protein [Halopiger goleimassiliensis]